MNIYHEPKNNYTRVPNHVIKNPELSPLAKVLFCILAALLSIHDFYPATLVLQRCSGRGKSTVAEAVAELRKAGYLKQYCTIYKGRNKWFYELYATPRTKEERASEVIYTQERKTNKYHDEEIGKYTAISNDILLCGSVEPVAKVLYCYLACHANYKRYVLHGWALADSFHLSEQTIQRYIRMLRELGLVNMTQSHDNRGRFGQMEFEINSAAPLVSSDLAPAKQSDDDIAAGHGYTGHDAAGHGCTGHDTAGHIHRPISKKTSLTKTEINHDKLPKEIMIACNWCPDRYTDRREQDVYDKVVRSIAGLYLGNNRMRAIIMAHFCQSDTALCQVTDEVTEDCFDRIYYPQDRTVIANPNGYITTSVKNRIIQLAESDQNERGLHHDIFA